MLRFANVLGPDVDTSHTRMFSLPMVPMILGFDPRYQFVHEDDVVHALEHAAFNDLPGIYNVAADGVLALSEVIGLLGKRPLPVLPPWGTGLVAGAAAPARLPRPGRDAQPDALRPRARQPQAQGDRLQLRLHLARGRAASSASTCGSARSCAGVKEPYRYEREVEEFLRWSPHVQRDAAPRRSARRTRRSFDPSPPGRGRLEPQARLHVATLPAGTACVPA